MYEDEFEELYDTVIFPSMTLVEDSRQAGIVSVLEHYWGEPIGLEAIIDVKDKTAVLDGMPRNEGRFAEQLEELGYDVEVR
mgnify:CR=1 FL=1